MIRTIKLEPKQAKCLDLLNNDHTRFLLFGGGAGGGKSWLICVWLLINCYQYPNSRWFLGRKELKRLLNTTYFTWNKVCHTYQIPRSDWQLNGQYNYIQFVGGNAKGSRIDLLDLDFLPSDPLFERFGSLEFTGGAIEEASEVSFKAFDILKTRVNRHLNKELGVLGKILLTCNPSKNWLYRTFYKPKQLNELPQGYDYVRATYLDNSYLDAEYEQSLSEISDKVTRERLKNGNWEYSDDDLALIRFDAINDLFTNVLTKSSTDRKYITADIARYGGDRIVIGVWLGYDLQKIIILRKLGIDQTADRLKQVIIDEAVPYSQVIVDDDGVGGGVADILRGVKRFINNSKPITDENHNIENFTNLKSQCAFRLAERVDKHEVAISANLSYEIKEEIIDELSALKQRENKDVGKLSLISKDDIKKNLGRSPDIADMMIMRFYFDFNTAVSGYHVPDKVYDNEGKFDYF